MQVTNIPLDKIFMDEEFNSRDQIQFTQVIDLAKSIKKDGLIQPIVVMPVEDKFKVVAGHRRTKAHMILANDDDKFKFINAIIRTDLDEIHARLLNINENLARKDLNILEEAQAIQPLLESGMTEEEMVNEIPSASRGWVQIRCMLLKLPKEVQEEAAVGFVTQMQIRDLYSMKHAGLSDELIFAQVRKAKDAKMKGEKYKVLNKKDKKQQTPSEQKHARSRNEIFVMMKHMLEHDLEGLHTRVLAWASGEISDLYIFCDFQDHLGDDNIKPRQGLDY